MGMTQKEMIEKLDRLLDETDDGPAGDVFDRLEKRAEELVEAGEFDSVGKASTHLMETDAELRKAYSDHLGSRDMFLKKGASGSAARELQRRARKRLQAGEFSTIGKAMTAVLEADEELRERYMSEGA